MDNTQLVSVGMVVYNGGQYIRESLDSLLAQEYENFELIISDDSSTDETSAICQEYTYRDKRIKYYRNKTNLGVYRNFKQVFDYSSGEYFMWAAQDDLWHPSYIRELISLLLKYDSAVLAGCQVTEFLQDKSKYWTVPIVPTTLKMTRMERIGRFVENTPHAICHLIYGMFRRDTLVNSKSLKLADKVNDSKVGFDHLIVFNSLVQGDVVISDKPLFFGRTGGLSYHIHQYSTFRERIAAFAKFSFLLRRCFECSHFSFLEKILLFKFCFVNDIKHIPFFYKEVMTYHLSRKIEKFKTLLFNLYNIIIKRLFLLI